jgi:hypothetical protein
MKHRTLIFTPLLLLLACQADDSTTMLEADSWREGDVDVDDATEGMDEPEPQREVTLQEIVIGERIPHAPVPFAVIERSFEGRCLVGAPVRSGTVAFTLFDSGAVRGELDDGVAVTKLPGTIDWNWSLEAEEDGPVGPCSWYGSLNLETNAIAGTWECKNGCSGVWGHS